MIGAAVLTIWVYLFTLNPYADGTVITVNWHYNVSVECCVNGACPCGNLSFALQNLGNDSIVNITSDFETLISDTPIGSGNLHNITITGNGTYILCYDLVRVYCELCSDVIIEGITWDGCSTNWLLFSAFSINVSYCSFCLTDNRLFTGYKSYGSLSLSIHFSTFASCVLYPEYLQFGGMHGAERHIILIDNSIFRVKLRLNLEGGSFFHVMILSSIFIDYSSLEVSTSSYGLQSYVTIEISNTTIRGQGISSIASRGANHTNISISNTQFVNNSIQRSADQLRYFEVAFAISINDNVGYLTMNNVSFVGNKGRDVLLWIEAQDLKQGLYITFHKTQFVSNNFTSRIVSIRHAATDVNNDIVRIIFTQCTWLYNNAGNSIVYVFSSNSRNFYGSFVLSDFVNSTGSALQIFADAVSSVTNHFTRCTFVNNTRADHGAALFLRMQVHVLIGVAYKNGPTSKVTLSQCKFNYNVAERSIVYIYDQLKEKTPEMILNSSSFINNIGSALYISSSTKLTLHSQNLFENNKAENGAAIYFNENSVFQLYSGNAPSARFIGNNAAFRGGAIYVDFIPFNQNCYLVSTNIIEHDTNYTAISFDHNSATVAGNDIYFNFHESCQVDVNGSHDADEYALSSIFSYTKPDGAITTAPYMVHLCSTGSCDLTNGSYFVEGPNMLGHPIYFSAQLYDYFYNTSIERVQFRITCTNCNSTYRLSHDQLLLNDGNETVTVSAVNATCDVDDEIALNFILTSVLQFELRQISTTLSFNLLPCFSGFAFSINSQICECYNDDDDVIQCTENNAEIRQGYWFGSVLGRRTVSLCPNYYCDFSHRSKTGNGYYTMPRELDGQCRPHRTGVACGDCSSGYTLAYNAPDCIDERKCSWMLPLAIVLTILYWIAIVVGVCGLTHSKFKISLGHLYGIIYYYSIVDILLGNNLYVSDGVFQVVAVISSFAKLTPQIIGKLCLIKGLSGIDLQFINYIHVIVISIILFGIRQAAKRSMKITKFAKHFIVRAFCVLLLLSYTSLVSTSLQLLRPLTFNDVDETFSYSSPDVKYFSGRHIAYGIVAILSAIVFVVGLPCLLLIEPFLKGRFNLIRIKPFLDQFQGCYKDKYSWFAAYFFICRLVLFLISYAVNNNQSRIYCLHTACVIIALNHIWIQPYSEQILNILDTTVLLNMVLVVNLSTSGFSEAATTGISISLIVIPLCCFCAVLAKRLITTWTLRKQNNQEYTFQAIRYVCI